ncbi:hypothetical protein FS842_005035 [Serendipita sp. 407]|nr:hypothetical protein FRC20_011282 [Serendipita sp. 405]KAG9054462.1 hypothetical protein FS842_005035 [Serendipita sp. 407]
MSLSDDKKMSTPRKPDDYTQRMKNTLREQDQIFMEVVSRNAELEKRIKELEYENWQLRSIADSLKKDLKASGSKYKDLEDSIDHLKIEHESFKASFSARHRILCHVVDLQLERESTCLLSFGWRWLYLFRRISQTRP